MNLHEIYLAAQLAGSKSGNADLSNYYTKSQIESLIAGKVNTDDTFEPYKQSVKEQIDNITDQIFGYGEKIPANSDLDNYKNPGIYYSSIAADSETMMNTPYKTGGFRLEVTRISSVDGCKQILYPNSRTIGTFYIRTYFANDDVFGSWFKFQGTEVTDT